MEDFDFAKTGELAESGDVDAMARLASALEDGGDKAGAEIWYRRAAEAGDPQSMTYLGFQFHEEGDLAQAETWYRRAAKAGQPAAKYNLGCLFRDRGKLKKAEVWFLQAAEVGHPAAMNSLGRLLRERGDLEGAETWYRRAAETDDASAMAGLGYVMKQKGDLEEAEVWLRRAAEAGRTDAMNNLGDLLRDRGDFEGAEALHRQAAEAGNVFAMSNLGRRLRDKGDLVEAEIWYERAQEAGSTFASDELVVLRRKLNYSDTKLDSIKFDTFGWPLSLNDDGVRKWIGDDAFLAEVFVDAPPDFESWDLDETRQQVTDSMELLESPTFRLEDFGPPEGVPEVIRKQMERLPTQVNLLEIELVEIARARCIVITTRHRANGDVHYSCSMMLLFAECYWILQLEVEEHGLVGAREGAVARAVREASTTSQPSMTEFDPYERRWDGIVPIEEDPLTRLRFLVDRLRNSIQLDRSLGDLAIFGT